MMKSRQKTLMTNVAIYAAIVILAGFNAWFWKSYYGKARAELKELELSLSKLNEEKKAKTLELESSAKQKQTYEAETDKRRQELEGYGDFLKKLSERSDSIEKLQALIESVGIRIQKATFNPPTRGEGNTSVFNFILELAGPYKAFKQLLYELPRQEQIFRIQSFDVMTFENKNHEWEVKIQLETYFSGQG